MLKSIFLFVLFDLFFDNPDTLQLSLIAFSCLKASTIINIPGAAGAVLQTALYMSQMPPLLAKVFENKFI